MPHTVTLPHFTGPLDLLLNLLHERKMNIGEVALSQVTEQYLAYMDKLEKEDADELADFLVIAAKLLLMKARALLPQEFAEEDEGPSLAEQLRLYQAYVKVSKVIQKRWASDAVSFFRAEPARKIEKFILPKNVSASILHEAMMRVVARLTPRVALPTSMIDRTISLQEKMNILRDLLRKAKKIVFSDLLSSANKTDMIVSFLALLELMKQHHIFLSQNRVFEEIVIERV